MSELAPGLIVSDRVEAGQAYAIDLSVVYPDGQRALVLAREDWERIDPIEREKLLDDLTRWDAEKGLDRLQAWLVTQLATS